MKMFGKNTKGFSLLELVLAIAIIGIVGSAVVVLGSNTILTARANQDRSQALAYSQEGMEAIRSTRDNNPTAFFSYTEGYYSLSGTTLAFVQNDQPSEGELGSYQMSGSSNHFRVVYLSPGTNNMEVMITTYFREKQALRSVDMTALFTNWQ